MVDARIVRLTRYAAALAGPVATAGAQFLLSLILLHALGTAAFGRFSFLLILSQFSWGVWSALFCAPLPILYARGGGTPTATMFAANAIGAAIGFTLFTLVALLLHESAASALLFAGYGAAALLRWFARAHAYAEGRPLRVTASDIVYSLALLAGTALLLVAGITSVAGTWAALAAAALTGLLPFGGSYLRPQFRSVRMAAARAYPPVWREHSRWSLLGVVTTELTANAHTYLVTALLGAGAFAPIAASSLMIRPMTVAMNAMTEFERAQMAREIGGGRIEGARAALRFCRMVLVAAWFATAALMALLLIVAPRLVFPPRYDLHAMVLAATLWMAVAAVRLARTADSALLQAAGQFRPLAGASLWSSAVSLAAVLALIAAAGPIWSITGIFVGEFMFAAAIWRRSGAWMIRAAEGTPCPA